MTFQNDEENNNEMHAFWIRNMMPSTGQTLSAKTSMSLESNTNNTCNANNMESCSVVF